MQSVASRDFSTALFHLLSKMNYEQFYRYLDSRPIAEIRDCLHNVAKLAKKHSITVDKENLSTGEIGAIAEQHRLQISHKVWFQHAVWNKFGSKAVEDVPANEFGLAVADLCAEQKVNDYIVEVNKGISERDSQKVISHKDTRGETSKANTVATSKR